MIRLLATLSLLLVVTVGHAQDSDELLKKIRPIATEAIAKLAKVGYVVDPDKLKIEVLSSDETLADLRRQQVDFFGPDNFILMSAFFSGLGVIPKDDPELLAKVTLDSLLGSIQAYYQADRNALVFIDSETGDLGRALSGLSYIVTHELVHAAQDQRADLPTTLAKSHGCTDRVRVRHCLIEGEAEWVFLSTTMNEEALRALKDADLRPDMESLLSGPIAAIYQVGRVFAAHRFRAGGWAALRSSAATPPTSTEQLIHPEKLGRDLPCAVTLPKLGLTGGRDDTQGELQIFTTLMALGVRRDDAFIAATGWDGDLIRTGTTATGDKVSVWRTVWDRDIDATQFVDAMKNAKGQCRQRGRVVDWRSAMTEKDAARVEAQLAAHPAPAAVPADATSTAAAEKEWRASRPAEAAVVGKWWNHADVGLSIPILPGWETQELRGTQFLVDVANSTATFSPNIGVQILQARPGVGIDELLEATKKEFDGIPQFKLDSIRKEKVSGRDVIFYEMHGDLGQPLHFYGVMYLRGSNHAVITATTTGALWKTHKESLRKLMLSIKIED